jgi:MFS family permease
VVRKGFVITGMAGTGLLFAAAGLTSGQVSTLMLIASGFTVGISGTMVFTIGQTLAGPRAGGRWMGIQNMCGNFSGIAAPIITGLVVDWSGSFAGAFFVAAGLSLIGVTCWAVVVQAIRPVDWSRSTILREQAATPVVV